jgi:Bacterial PH domain
VEKPQTFRSPTAVVIWAVWLLFAVGNWIDLAVQGRDQLSVVAAAVLLLATGVAYVTAQRPRIIADDTGVTVRNPLRDHRIGWAGVTRIDLVDLLRVHCAWGPQSQHRKVISAWAVHYPRRRQLAADVKARRAARRSAVAVPAGFGSPDEPAGAREPASAAEADAQRIVRLLSDRATAARAEALWSAAAEPVGRQAIGTATGEEQPAATAVAPTGWAEPLTSTWSRRALAALVIPALILLIVCLV